MIDKKVLACQPRNRQTYLNLIAELDVEHNPRYLARDVTGDGKAETFCNIFLGDCSMRLGAPIPHMLANQQVEWLSGPAGPASGWLELLPLPEATVDAQAVARAELGLPTVAVWANPTGGHGHVGFIVPAEPPTPGVHIAAAGARNFQNAPIQRSFGVLKYRVFTHA